MTTAIAPTTPPAPAADPAQDAQRRIDAATARVQELRQEAARVNAAFDAAVDAGDRDGLAKARARYLEIGDALLIEQRAILSAQVALAQAAYDAGHERLKEANAVAEEAIRVAAEVEAQSHAKRRQDVDEGRLPLYQYNGAVEVDCYDVQRERQRATFAATGARNALMEPQYLLEQAEGALAAHRRRRMLTVDE